MHRAMRCARGPACIYHWAARLQQGYERRGQRAVSQGEEAAREAGQGTDGLRGDCTCEQRNLQRGRGARGCEGGARGREGARGGAEERRGRGTITLPTPRPHAVATKPTAGSTRATEA